MGIRWGRVPSAATYVAQTSMAYGNRTQRGLVGRESGPQGYGEKDSLPQCGRQPSGSRRARPGNHAHRARDVRTVAVVCQREEEGHSVVRSQVAGQPSCRETKWTAPALIAAVITSPGASLNSSTVDRVTIATRGKPQSRVTRANAPNMVTD